MYVWVYLCARNWCNLSTKHMWQINNLTSLLAVTRHIISNVLQRGTILLPVQRVYPYRSTTVPRTHMRLIRSLMPRVILRCWDLQTDTSKRFTIKPQTKSARTLKIRCFWWIGEVFLFLVCFKYSFPSGEYNIKFTLILCVCVSRMLSYRVHLELCGSLFSKFRVKFHKTYIILFMYYPGLLKVIPFSWSDEGSMVLLALIFKILDQSRAYMRDSR